MDSENEGRDGVVFYVQDSPSTFRPMHRKVDIIMTGHVAGEGEDWLAGESRTATEWFAHELIRRGKAVRATLPPPPESARIAAAAGRISEAITAYRAAHPSYTVQEAVVALHNDMPRTLAPSPGLPRR